MLTGIVEAIGTIRGVQKGAQSSVLTIQTDGGQDGMRHGGQTLNDIKIGDSVAVNGVCLTVANCETGFFSADVMHETLRRTNLGNLRMGSKVNLERALLANGRFGGHIVSGHIDGTGVVTKITKDDNAVWFEIRTSSQIMKYIIEKGSIAIDGVSLTVAEVQGEVFSISMIPHTLRATAFSNKQVGDSVNLENDLVGKYIEKFLGYTQNSHTTTQGTITREFLERAGF